jgi:outer membrane lipoprotein-sorting protein
MTHRRMAVQFVTAFLLSMMVGSVGAANEGLSELMTQLAQRQHGHAAFVETQFIALLKHPLESTGELFYDAPDRLEKRTLAPKPESLVLDKDTLKIRRGTRQYSFSLRAYPQIGPYIESIRATLAGNLAALESTYALKFDTGADRWTLELVPRDARLVAMIKRIQIAGSRDSIRTIEILRADGDRSVMTISELPAG